MNKLIALSIAVCGLAAFAEEPPFDFHTKPKDEAERQARKAYAERKMYERHGDLLLRAGSQQGEIVIVNCQKSAPVSLMKDRLDYFVKETKFKVSIKDGAFDSKSPKVMGSASLFVVDDAALPPVLVAPESRWAMINIAPLKTDKTAFFEARVKKEVIRGLGWLCGACNSNYPNSILGGMPDIGCLDNNPEFRLQADVFRRMPTYMKPFGVTPAQYATYRQACQEGWAPAPTNDVQKNIWNDVHAPPEKPLKITYDKDKQKPVVK